METIFIVQTVILIFHFIRRSDKQSGGSCTTIQPDPFISYVYMKYTASLELYWYYGNDKQGEYKMYKCCLTYFQLQILKRISFRYNSSLGTKAMTIANDYKQINKVD